MCLGGPLSEAEVRWAVAASPNLTIFEDLVLDRDAVSDAGSIRSRAVGHTAESGAYVAMTLDFVRTLVAAAPFIRSVSIAGSLASGGFRPSDDVDLNLIVDDGHRHLAYVVVNLLGLAHAMRHRAKPVDDLTRRPLAPRLMTANLILERSQYLPLQRDDEDMAFEFLIGEPVFGLVSAVVLAMTIVVLFVFGTNLLYLTFRAIRLPPPPRRRFVSDQEPVVCVQVPIYNERYVAERVIDAVCSIDWPRDRLHVQVLDDSDDETTHIAGKRIARWQRKGLHVDHVRRRSRNGFKAGALAFGLERTDARLIAIFDADFVPAPDFLRRTIGAFDEPSVGFVQARWGHLDEGYTLFTRLQAMAIDFHFLIEQPVRSAAGYFPNFTGTAGVWRRAAIEDAGGWSARTLTEDLDLSYRAQLRGWKAAYIEELVVPEELPVSIDAYRRQQSRWATGSFQSAFQLLGSVLRGKTRPAVKFQAAIHLLAYGVGPVMLVQLACYPLLLLTLGQPGLRLPWYLTYASAISIVVGVTPWIGFIAAQTRRGRRWWAGLPAFFCQIIGAGMSLNTLLSLARAAKPGGVFVRTPKHRIVKAGQEWRNQAYVRVGDPRALIEAIAGLGALAMVPVALDRHQVLIAIYSGMFALGFLAVAGLSLVDLLEVLTLRRLGARALARIQPGPPGGCAVRPHPRLPLRLRFGCSRAAPHRPSYGKRARGGAWPHEAGGAACGACVCDLHEGLGVDRGRRCVHGLRDPQIAHGRPSRRPGDGLGCTGVRHPSFLPARLCASHQLDGARKHRGHVSVRARQHPPGGHRARRRAA